MGDRNRDVHPDNIPRPDDNRRPDLNQSVDSAGESGDATEAIPADTSGAPTEDVEAEDVGGLIDGESEAPGA